MDNFFHSAEIVSEKYTVSSFIQYGFHLLQTNTDSCGKHEKATVFSVDLIFSIFLRCFVEKKNQRGTLFFCGPPPQFFVVIVKVSERSFEYQWNVIYFSPFLNNCCF